MKNTKKNNQAGFGLVEVLVSMTIFLAVALALSDMVNITYANWDNAKSKAIAYNILQSQMEKYRNIRDTNFVVGTASATSTTWDSGIITTTIDPPTNVDKRDYTTKVEVGDINPSIAGIPPAGTKKEVKVTVSWTGRSGDRQIQAITYLDDWKIKY